MSEPLPVPSPISPLAAVEADPEPLCLICRASFQAVGSLCRACFHEHDDPEVSDGASNPVGPDAHAA